MPKLWPSSHHGDYEPGTREWIGGYSGLMEGQGGIYLERLHLKLSENCDRQLVEESELHLANEVAEMRFCAHVGII
jgi:hypothetical protein